MHDMLIPLALVSAVLLVSGLISSAVQRAPFSMPIIFLGLGLLFGDGGLGALHVDVHDHGLAALAVLSLAFVLFLDAVNLRVDKGQRLRRALLLALGPGTLLTAGLVAAAAHLILGLALPASLMVGAILASIDPVVLRDVVRDERVPSSIRQELTTEAGANDIIVLPIVLILATNMRGQTEDAAEWLLELGRLFVLGPLAGVAVGLASVWVMRQARSRFAIESEYRAVFGIGAILAAYVVGEAVGGSGFLAILAGGAAVIATDYDLCDCLLEYSETTADILMPFAFVLFGALLSPLVTALPLLPTLLFAAAVLLVARPLAIALVLRRSVTSARERLFIGWFGPRGLSSLLIALIIASQGVPGAKHLLAITGVVVIASVVAHGITARPLAAAFAQVTTGEGQMQEPAVAARINEMCHA